MFFLENLWVFENGALLFAEPKISGMEPQRRSPETLQAAGSSWVIESYPIPIFVFSQVLVKKTSHFSRDFLLGWYGMISPFSRQVEPDEQRDLRPGCWDLRGGLCRHACGAAWWQGIPWGFHGDWWFHGDSMVISWWFLDFMVISWWFTDDFHGDLMDWSDISTQDWV